MLIDDSEADLLFSRIIVGRSGVCDDVLEFESARTALAHLQAPGADEVDLILLDLNMPGMDGFQFLEAYAPLHLAGEAHAVVVVLTSSPDPRDLAQAEGFGCVCGYVVKPIDLAAARKLATLVGAAAPPAR